MLPGIPTSRAHLHLPHTPSLSVRTAHPASLSFPGDSESLRRQLGCGRGSPSVGPTPHTQKRKHSVPDPLLRTVGADPARPRAPVWRRPPSAHCAQTGHCHPSNPRGQARHCAREDSGRRCSPAVGPRTARRHTALQSEGHAHRGPGHWQQLPLWDFHVLSPKCSQRVR